MANFEKAPQTTRRRNSYDTPAVRRAMNDYLHGSTYKRRRGLRYRLRSFSLFTAFVIVGITVFALGLGTMIVGSTVTNTFHSCSVTNKDRTTGTKGTSDMRVYANCEGNPAVQVFSVNDNPFVLQFNSADIYGNIEVGKTYDFTTHGFRIPVLSMFDNIATATASR